MVMDQLVIPDVSQLQRALELLWNMKVAEGEAMIAQNIDRHPAFAVFQSEVSVCRAVLTETKTDYATAYKRLETSRKRVEALYKICRPDLKAFVATLPPPTKQATDDPESLQTLDQIGCVSTTDDAADTDDAPGPLSADAQVRQLKVTNGLYCKLLVAELLLWEACLKFKQLKYVKGMIDFRSSWKRFEECAYIRSAIRGTEETGTAGPASFPLFDLLSTSIDFGMGIFHFALSVVPRHFQWLVEGIGFKGDRLLALQEIEFVMNSTEFRAPLAAMLMSWVQGFFFFDCRKADKILEKEIATFPTCAPCFYTIGYVARKQGNLEKAVQAFQSAYDTATELPDFQLKIEYELGYNNTLQLQWKQALVHLEHYLNGATGEAFRAYCGFQIGLAYHMLEDKKRAKEYMKKLLSWVRKGHAYDEYAERRAKQFIKMDGYRPFMSTYLCATLLHEACNFTEALEWLTKAEPLMEFVDEKVCHNYLAGSCHAHLKDYAKAKEYYESTLPYDKRVTDETHAIPWSLCGLAEIAVLERQFESAEAYIRRARTYNSYDFESFLGWRLRKAEDDIRRVKARMVREAEEQQALAAAGQVQEQAPPQQ